MGTIVAFRIGQPDVEALSKYFHPQFDGNDLLRIPNHNTIIRTLIGGVPTQPFSMATLPPLGTANEQLSGALKQLSAAKYGRPKSVVEKEIFERLATKVEPTRPYGGAAGGGFGAPANAPYGARPGGQPAGPPGTGSFIDEWMTKRKGPLSMRPSPWSKPAPAQQPQGSPINQQGSNSPFPPTNQQPMLPPVQPLPSNVPAPTPSSPLQSSVNPTPPQLPTPAHGEIPLRNDNNAAQSEIFIDEEGIIHSK
jgi:hypothetical protein